MREINYEELFASYELWSLVEDVSDDGDGVFELTKEGELFVAEIEDYVEDELEVR